MSDPKQKVAPEKKKDAEEQKDAELSDEALERVSGGMAAAIPGVGGASSLSSRETGSCIS